MNSPSTTDLVGGPFAVIESDPGVFTSLTRRLGIQGLELIELYDIEPWAVDHLHPYGLIFCFMWKKDSHRPTDFNDPAAERVWFANQLSDDACATHAILNVLLNCPSIDLGEELREFRKDTERMSPVMRGLAITNSPIIRPAHNAFARPSDIRAATNQITTTTLDVEKRKEKQRKQAEAASTKPPPSKCARVAKTASTTSATKGKPKPKSKGKQKQKDKDKEDDDAETDEASDTDQEERENEEETYHFIGYVPAHGKVWELDGLKSGPLEVGELPFPLAPGHPHPMPSSSASSFNAPLNPIPNHVSNSTQGWMDVVRPALRMKMEKYGGSGTDGSNIRFSLLAIVDDTYKKASDEFELIKRERIALERRLGDVEGWEERVDRSTLESSRFAFTLQSSTSQHEQGLGKTFAPDFGARKMEKDLTIMKMSPEELLPAWETCVRNATIAKVAVEDELSKAVRSNTDHVKRTFDYEPFIREYISRLHNEGLLNPLLNRDNEGRKKRGRKKATVNASKG